MLSFIFFYLLNSSLATSPEKSSIKVGFFPDHIISARTEKTGLYQEVLFFKQIGQTLVEAGPADELIPGIAEKWSISNDRKVYKFTLRKGVKFHDGTPLTPQDVVNAFNRNIYSKENSLRIYLANLRGLQIGWKNQKCPGIAVTGKREVTFTLERPYSPLLRMLTSGITAIFRQPVEGQPLVGTGPYMVSKKGNEHILSAYSSYIGAYPASIKEIRLLVSSDYLYGKKPIPNDSLPDFDAFVPISAKDKYSLKNYTITRAPNLGTIGFYPNTRSKNCLTAKQRIAVLALLDRATKNTIDAFSQEVPGTILNDIYPRGMLAHQANRTSLVELKKKLHTVDLSDLPKQITIAATGQLVGNTERFLAEIRKISSIKVDAKVLDPSKLITEINKGEFDVLHQIWHSVINEPHSLLIVLKLIKSFDQKSSNLIQAAVEDFDDKSRVKIYSKLADYMFEQALFLPIYQRDHISALRKEFRIKNFFYRYSSMLSEIDLK